MRLLHLSMLFASLRWTAAATSSDAAETNSRRNLSGRAMAVLRHYWDGNNEADTDQSVESIRDSSENVFRHNYIPPSTPGGQVIKHPFGSASEETIGTKSNENVDDPDIDDDEGTNSDLVPTNCDLESKIDTVVLIHVTLLSYDGNEDQVSRFLEDNFAEAYEEVECGIRNLTNVMIEDQSELMEIPAPGSDSRARDRLIEYFIRVEGKCAGCKSEDRLFGEAVDPVDRHLSQSLGPNKLHHYLRKRILQDEPLCACPPPSKKEFLDSLTYSGSGCEVVDGILTCYIPIPNPLLEATINAEDMFELDPVDCPSEETVFDTSVEMTFDLNGSTDKTSEQLETIASIFVFAYNLVNSRNGDLCDPLFRELSEASLTKVLTDGTNEERYTVTASGTCRGCTDGTSLFDLSGRRMPESSGKEDAVIQSFNDLGGSGKMLARRLQDATCYCPVGSINQGPAKEEFLLAFNEFTNSSIVDVLEA